MGKSLSFGTGIQERREGSFGFWAMACKGDNTIGKGEGCMARSVVSQLHGRMDRRIVRLLVVAIIAIHVTLVLCYTLPISWVPDRLQAWSQHYVRPWFHQRWNLFAPDPSECDRVLEVGLPDGSWRPLIPEDRPHLMRRMSRPLAQMVSDGLRSGGPVDPILASSLRGLARDIGPEVGELRFRLVERCVLLPAEPARRSLSLIPLDLPVP